MKLWNIVRDRKWGEKTKMLSSLYIIDGLQWCHTLKDVNWSLSTGLLILASLGQVVTYTETVDVIQGIWWYHQGEIRGNIDEHGKYIGWCGTTSELHDVIKGLKANENLSCFCSPYLYLVLYLCGSVRWKYNSKLSLWCWLFTKSVYRIWQMIRNRSQLAYAVGFPLEPAISNDVYLWPIRWKCFQDHPYNTVLKVCQSYDSRPEHNTQCK